MWLVRLSELVLQITTGSNANVVANACNLLKLEHGWVTAQREKAAVLNC